MSDALNVTVRTTRGKRHARRQRSQGHVPLILYGHGEQNVSLSCRADELSAALRHGSRLVELRGDVNEKAFIRALQWDTFGVDVLHVDLTRVSEDESVEVSVPLELRGEAPGAKEGGAVEQLLHEVTILCPAGSIPEKIGVRIGDLQLGASIALEAVERPAGVEWVTDPHASVVQCVLPTERPEEELAVAPTAEPELIGRKAEAEAEEE